MHKYLIIITTYVATLYVATLPSLASENISITNILDKYRETQDRLQSFIAKSENTMESTLSTNPGGTLSYKVSEFRTDGDRVDYRAHIWKPDTKDNLTPTENASYRSFIWDSKSFFEHRRSIADTGISFITDNDSKKQNQVSVIYHGAPLMGIFFGDDQRIDHILQKASTISLRDKTENVAGSDCYIIDAETQHGSYTVWIDPKHGYNIAKAKLEKDEFDIAWNGKTINELDPQNANAPIKNRRGFGKRTRLSFSLQKVHFKKVGDLWAPMETDYQYKKFYEDGRVVTVTNHHKRTEINLNPDFTAVGAFISDIPDGTSVYLESAPGIKYIMQEGKPVPDVDKYMSGEIDRITDEIMAEDKVHSGLPTDQITEGAPNERGTPIDTESKKQVDTVESTPVILSESRSSLVLVLILIGLSVIGIIIWLVLRLHKA